MLLIDPTGPPADTGTGWLAVTVPGRLVAIRSSGEARDGDLVEALWSALAAPDGMTGALEALSGRGLVRTPPFVVAEWSGDPFEVRVFVRGDSVVVIDTGDGERSVSGAGVSTWSEVLVSGVTGFRVRLATGTAAGTATAQASRSRPLPLAAGAAWIDGVAWSAGDSGPDVPPQEASSAPPTEDLDLHEVQDANADAGRHDADVDAADHAAAAADAAEHEGRADLDVAAVVAEETLVVGQTMNATAPADDTDTDDTDDVADDLRAAAAPASGDDALFGATVLRSIEDAAIRPAGSGDAEPDEGESTGAESTADPSGVGLIEPPASVTDSLPSRPAPGDHDGMTVMSGDLDELRRSGGAPDVDDAAPGSGTADDPTGYRLRLPDGSVEELVGELLVGRAPAATKVSGSRVPRLVTVDSPEHDISRTHVRIALEGDTVVVTDLHSRNGTTVVLPGRSPQKLRQGEPTAVIADALVDLGSGVVLTVESA